MPPSRMSWPSRRHLFRRTSMRLAWLAMALVLVLAVAGAVAWVHWRTDVPAVGV